MSTGETSLLTWRMEVKNRPIQKGLVFHSDRGVQYAKLVFAHTLYSQKVTRSMSWKANCWDNAMAESYFKSLNPELIYGNNHHTKQQMRLEIFEYIELRLMIKLNLYEPRKNMKNYAKC